MLKILFFGDVSAKIGRKGLIKALPSLKKKYKPDFVLANADNIAHGFGITPKTLKPLHQAGIDFFTSGNHVFDRPEAEEILNQPEPILVRPANYKTSIGRGYAVVNIKDLRVLIIHLSGQAFMPASEFEILPPFEIADQILQDQPLTSVNAIIVDIHAEATSEKMALAWYLDGRVSAVVGSHTHVLTADQKILPQGTAYITDIGMTGHKDSVIGVDVESVLEGYRENKKIPYSFSEKGRCMINGVYIEIHHKTGLARKIELVKKELNIK